VWAALDRPSPLRILSKEAADAFELGSVESLLEAKGDSAVDCENVHIARDEDRRSSGSLDGSEFAASHETKPPMQFCPSLSFEKLNLSGYYW
jgi:hypothetical protein